MDSLPLRDIHLPQPVGLWPPAVGWWLLAILVIGLAVLAVLWMRRQRRVTPAKLALCELDLLAADAGLDAGEKLRRLSTLLRRVCLSVYAREEVAALTGEEWLCWLDRPLAEPRFSQGIGRLLIEAPYRPTAAADADALVALCRDWVRALAKSGNHRR